MASTTKKTSGTSSGGSSGGSSTGSNKYKTNIEKQLTTTQNSTYTPTTYSNPYGEQLLALTALKSDAEYRKIAENYHKSQRDADIMALQDANAKNQLTYEKQLATLYNTYTDSYEQQQAANAQAVSAVNNSALRRGMARSSYALQTEANTYNAGLNALSKLERDYMTESNYIQGQSALAITQMNDNIARLHQKYEADVLNYMETLKGNDKSAQMNALSQMASSHDSWMNAEADRQFAFEQNKSNQTNALLQFLYNAETDEQRYNDEMDLRAMEMAAASSGGSGGGGGGGGNNDDDDDDDDNRKKKTTSGNNYNVEWNDFSSYINTTGSTTSTGSQPVNIYSAAAQYALEQIRKMNGEI